MIFLPHFLERLVDFSVELLQRIWGLRVTNLSITRVWFHRGSTALQKKLIKNFYHTYPISQVYFSTARKLTQINFPRACYKRTPPDRNCKQEMSIWLSPVFLVFLTDGEMRGNKWDREKRRETEKVGRREKENLDVRTMRGRELASSCLLAVFVAVCSDAVMLGAGRPAKQN